MAVAAIFGPVACKKLAAGCFVSWLVVGTICRLCLALDGRAPRIHHFHLLVSGSSSTVRSLGCSSFAIWGYRIAARARICRRGRNYLPTRQKC